MEEKNKLNKKIFTWIVIAIALLLFIGAFFLGQSLANKEDEVTNKDIQEENESNKNEKSKITYEELCDTEGNSCLETLVVNGKEYFIRYEKENDYALSINGKTINESRFSGDEDYDRLISIEVYKDIAIVAWYNGGPVISVYNLKDGNPIQNIISGISVSNEYNSMQLTDSEDEYSDYMDRKINIYEKEIYKLEGNKIVFNGYLSVNECHTNSKNDIVAATYELEYLGDGKFKKPVMTSSKTLEETGVCKDISSDEVTTKEEAKVVAQRVYEYAYDRINEGSNLISYMEDYEKEYKGDLVSCQRMYFTVLESSFTENAITHIKDNYAQKFSGDDNYYLCDIWDDGTNDFLDTIFSSTDSGPRDLKIVSFTSDTIVATGQIK